VILAAIIVGRWPVPTTVAAAVALADTAGRDRDQPTPHASMTYDDGDDAR
jgi:hypothetical protein